ncbi:DUF4044 domain-containing protein [Philodulcilactobacillus myokoensis]|nr:DUF4044 domain-containing protein [Philodulcilactobacillus myokoensis]
MKKKKSTFQKITYFFIWMMVILSILSVVLGAAAAFQ